MFQVSVVHLANYQHSTYIRSEKTIQVIRLVVLKVLPFLSSEETQVDRIVRLQYWVTFVRSG